MTEQELLEVFALVHKADNYPPIAGKILGLFFLSNEKHLSFETIMDRIGASKSATSKALKFLISIEDVCFIYSTESKKRRLFFRNPDGMKTRIRKVIEAHRVETVLLKEVLSRRNSDNPEMNDLILSIIGFNNNMLKLIPDLVTEHFGPE